MIIKHRQPLPADWALRRVEARAAGAAFHVPIDPPVGRPRLAGLEADPFIEEEAATQFTPEDLLAQARVEAEAIRSAATAEAAMLREQVLHEGYQAGLDEGRLAAAQVVDTSVEHLRILASTAAIDRVALLRDTERQVLDLALAIAHAVLRREVMLDPTIIAGTLDALLTHLQGEAVTSLRAHPDDVPLLGQLWAERARSAADREVKIVADRRVAPGGCVIETVTGAWDASLDTQLERIQGALRSDQGGGQ